MVMNYSLCDNHLSCDNENEVNYFVTLKKYIKNY